MNCVENILRCCLFCLSLFVLILVPGISPCQAGVIIGFGDSLTEGCDVQTGGDCGWVGGTGYTGELELLLTSNGYNYNVYNFGRGGETTTEGVNRIDTVLDEACNQGAKYILILEGTNDLLHGASGLDVKFNLGIMIDKSRAKGVEPLLATITPDPNPEHAYKNIPLMNTYIRALAAKQDVVLVDLYAAMYPYWDTYTNPRACYNDLLHPNPTGFDAMAAVWYATLAELLPRPLTWLHLLLKTP